MKKPLILLLSLIFITLSACKKGPKDDGILIVLKDNKPCFYLDKSLSSLYKNSSVPPTNVSGQEMWDQHIVVRRSSEQADDDSAVYSGLLPVLKDEASCFSFPNFQYKPYDIYYVSHSAYTLGFFCLAENNGKLQVNQVIKTDDFTNVCSDKEYSNDRGFWYKIKRFFSRVFY